MLPISLCCFELSSYDIILLPHLGSSIYTGHTAQWYYIYDLNGRECVSLYVQHTNSVIMNTPTVMNYTISNNINNVSCIDNIMFTVTKVNNCTNAY